MPKSTEATVFVRLIPTPAHKVMRHQLEDIFSETGPIKKSSWIHSQQKDTSKGYGFVKYVSHDDAEAAATKLNKSKITMFGKEYLLKVELASVQADTSAPSGSNESFDNVQKVEDANVLTGDDNPFELKKKSRVILRNVSFYANEQQIQKSMEKAFGDVTDVHLPHVQSNLHVGFCFVTFANPSDAAKAVEAKTVTIKKRPASINWSIPKKLHQQNSRQNKSIQNRIPDEGWDASNPTVVDANTAEENSEDNSDVDSQQDIVSTSSQESVGDDSSSDDDQKNADPTDAWGIREKRVLFLRNLPFDTTRHDLFRLLSKFGHIQSIYLVRDKSTGMLKGTAFVTFSKAQSADRVVQSTASGSSSFVSQRDSTTDATGAATSKPAASSLVLNGRGILVDFAVDKETATTFETKQNSMPSADRRNMYLQAEARVESSSLDPGANNANTWDDLPDQDQKKRQNALKDKTTKLQSPLFFINPKRLSIRNLAKHVDESSLQMLCKTATIRGLKKNLVGAKDQIAHWRALGDMSTRDILSKIQEYEQSGEQIIPSWDPKMSIKEYLPSVYIDRDFGPSGKKTNAPSRGFGFAEFKHHVHALACLRELNNNLSYSSEYVAGASMANEQKKKIKKRSGQEGSGGGAFVGDDGRVRVPRLIIDFVVSILGVWSRRSSIFNANHLLFPDRAGRE